MIRLVDNLEAEADEFLVGLNNCFPGWGNERTFDWCFRRLAGGPPADLFVARESGALVAGSANTYRKAQCPDAGQELIGCMTASWTHRAARGRGLFQEIIDQSRKQARRRGCRLLIAFAGAGKASRPGLLAAGAVAVEGAFLTSNGHSATDAFDTIEPTNEEIVAAFSTRSVSSRLARLTYTPEEWQGQMLDRPGPVERWRLNDGTIAIIQRAGGIARLLDISSDDGEDFMRAVLQTEAMSNSLGLRLSVYSLDRVVIDKLIAHGFTATRAWLYLMGTDDNPPEHRDWWFANGDRM